MVTDNVICRWCIDDLILDVMPTDQKILGFSNRWYEEAIQHKVNHQLEESISIFSVTAPYFLATKLEAFKCRSNHDYVASHDLEDITAVLDGRPELVTEIRYTPSDLYNYLCTEVKQLLSNQQFLSALHGHLNDYGSIAYDRDYIVTERLRKITADVSS